MFISTVSKKLYFLCVFHPIANVLIDCAQNFMFTSSKKEPATILIAEVEYLISQNYQYNAPGAL